MGKAQQLVYEYIVEHPNCTYNDIVRSQMARDNSLHHNAVTGRVKELRDMGYIVLSGTKVDEYTNKPNNTYRPRMDGEPPDDTSDDAIPKMPRETFERLRSMTHKDGPDGIHIASQSNVRFVIERKENKVSLRYGNFVNIRNILVACEDIEHNHYVVTGCNFTVLFKIK